MPGAYSEQRADRISKWTCELIKSKPYIKVLFLLTIFFFELKYHNIPGCFNTVCVLEFFAAL